MRPASSTSARSANRAGLGEIVRDHHAGQILIAHHSLDGSFYFKLGGVVQRRRGFVEQEHQRRIGQGACHGNTLGFAPGKIGDVALGVTFESDLGQEVCNRFVRQLLTALGWAEAEIVRHRAREQDMAAGSPCRVCGAGLAARCCDSRSLRQTQFRWWVRPAGSAVAAAKSCPSRWDQRWPGLPPCSTQSSHPPPEFSR